MSSPAVSPTYIEVPSAYQSLIREIKSSKYTTPALENQGELKIFFRSFEALNQFHFILGRRMQTTTFENMSDFTFQIIFVGKEAYSNLDQAIVLLAEKLKIAP